MDASEDSLKTNIRSQINKKKNPLYTHPREPSCRVKPFHLKLLGSSCSFVYKAVKGDFNF